MEIEIWGKYVDVRNQSFTLYFSYIKVEIALFSCGPTLCLQHVLCDHLASRAYVMPTSFLELVCATKCTSKPQNFNNQWWDILILSWHSLLSRKFMFVSNQNVELSFILCFLFSFSLSFPGGTTGTSRGEMQINCWLTKASLVVSWWEKAKVNQATLFSQFSPMKRSMKTWIVRPRSRMWWYATRWAALRSSDSNKNENT